MKRREFLKVAGAASLSLPVAMSALPKPSESRLERPNVLFLLADDWGWGDLGCFGHRVVKTPCLDALSWESCRFTDLYVSTPVCAPSRAGAMTGRDPNRYGMKFLCNDGQYDSPIYHHVPLEEPMLSRQLQAVGYRTGHIGKWHLSLSKYDAEPTPHDYGFDHYLILEKGPTNGSWGKGMYRNPSEWSRNGRPVFGKMADWTPHLYVDEAIRFIESCEGRPFFLNLWTFTPHEDVDCDERFRSLYTDRTPQEQTYFGAITQMDEQFGRLFSHLEKNGLRDNTIVIFTSDNGPEHPLLPWAPNSRGSTGPFRGAKGTLYEGGIRVPGIVRWPGLSKANTVSTVPVSLLDLFPTLCAAAGASLPESVEFDGVDIRAALSNEPVERHRPLYWQYDRSRDHLSRGETHVSPPVAVRDGRWKLLCDLDIETGVELYDLDIDMGEKWNLAGLHPEVVERLLAVAREIFADINGPYSREAHFLNPEVPDVRMKP